MAQGGCPIFFSFVGSFLLQPNIEKEREPVLLIFRIFFCVFEKIRERIRWETKLAREASSPLLGTMIFTARKGRLRGLRLLSDIG